MVEATACCCCRVVVVLLVVSACISRAASILASFTAIPISCSGSTRVDRSSIASQSFTFSSFSREEPSLPKRQGLEVELANPTLGEEKTLVNGGKKPGRA